MPPPPRPATEVTNGAWSLEANVQGEPSVSDKASMSQDKITALEEYRPNGSTFGANCALKQTTTSESCREETIGKTSIRSISPVAGPIHNTEDEFLAVRKGMSVIDLTQDSTPEEEGSTTITIEDLHREHWREEAH